MSNGHIRLTVLHYRDINNARGLLCKLVSKKGADCSAVDLFQSLNIGMFDRKRATQGSSGDAAFVRHSIARSARNSMALPKSRDPNGFRMSFEIDVKRKHRRMMVVGTCYIWSSQVPSANSDIRIHRSSASPTCFRVEEQ